MKNKNIQALSGYFFALGATIIWSGNFIIARDLSDILTPLSLAFYRWFVAVSVILPFSIKSLIENKNILKKHPLYLSITSLLGITIFNTLIYYASHTTTAINLSLISITFPVFIIIISRIVFKEKITLQRSIGIILVVIGVIILITKGDISKLLNISFAVGDLWMLTAAVTFAVYSILIRRKPAELSIRALQSSTFTIGLIFLLPFFIYDRMTNPSIHFDAKIIVSILYAGILASLFGFIFWNKAIMKIGASKAGIIYYTLPLFSGISAYIFLKESITMIHFYSSLLIITGIFAANYEPKKSLHSLKK